MSFASDGPWIIASAVALVFFGVFETRALLHPDRFDTLSTFLRDIGTRWPLTIFCLGVFAGAMAIHLYGCTCALR